MENARSLKNLDAFIAVDAHEQVGRKEGQDGLDLLPVFPNPDGLIGRQERFNVSQVQVPDRRLFVLGDSEDRIPSAL